MIRFLLTANRDIILSSSPSGYVLNAEANLRASELM